jgi:hypothetical protein
MASETTKSPVEMRMLNGNLGATTDFWFLTNGNIPDGELVVTGQDAQVELSLTKAEGRPGAFPPVTVLGHFVSDAQPNRLARFVVAKCVAHSVIAEQAFAIFASQKGVSAEDNWLRAERELLGL